MPMAPEALTRTVDIPLSYLASAMAGIRIPPRAATAAAPEPEMAAKKQDVTTTTVIRPLLRCPTQVSAKRISFSEMPAYSMMAPARTKKGTARRAYLHTEA